MEEEIKEEISRDKYSIPDEKETFFPHVSKAGKIFQDRKKF